jgi:hypothetical protein
MNQYFSLRSFLKTRKDQSSSQEGRVPSSSELLFYLGFQLIGWGLLTLGKMICVIQSTEWNVNPIQKHLSRKTFLKYPGTPWPSPVDKIKHHTMLSLYSSLTLNISQIHIMWVNGISPNPWFMTADVLDGTHRACRRTRLMNQFKFYIAPFPNNHYLLALHLP